jgi:hypothetical protein
MNEVWIETPEGRMPVRMAHARMWFDSASWAWSDCSFDGVSLTPPDYDEEEGHGPECGPGGCNCSHYWCPSLRMKDAQGKIVWRGHLSMDR